MGIFKIGLSFSGFAIPLLYQLCMAIDAIIYEVADRSLRAFFEMAKLSADVQAYSEEIGWILQRVMVLVGVYALFRVSIMLINYLIDPNKVSDASKNGTAIVKNIIVAIILLIVSPFVFTLLGKFQGMIITENVIPKIVYGPKVFEDNDEDSLIKNQSARFVNNVFLLFFVPDGVDCAGPGKGTYYCQDYNNVKEAKGNAGVSRLIGYASSKYFTYTPFVSGIVGMMLVYYFAVFTIELAKRIIKLIVLQVVSPVPIIMSVDPSQKDRINKFVKAYSGVYLQVFIRIITMYLAFVVLGLITESNFGTDAVGNGMLLAQPSWFVKVLLYIGVFQAAKELPKLIEDAIGVKMGETPGGGFGKVLTGILGGTAGFVGGTAAGALGGAAGGAASALGGALAGGLTGMFGGATKAMAAKNAVAAAGSSVSSIKSSYALGGNIAGAGGLRSFMLGGAENFFGGKRKDEATINSLEGKIKKEDDKISEYNKTIGGFNKELGEKQDLLSQRTTADQLRSNLENTFSDKHGSLNKWLEGDKDYLSARELLSQATDPTDQSYLQGQLNKARSRVEQSYNSARDTYFTENFSRLSSGTADVDFAKALEEYNQFVNDHGMADRTIASYRDANSISDAKEINEREKIAIQKEVENYQEQIKQEQVKIENSEKSKKDFQDTIDKFKKTDQYVRRNKREEPPKPKSRDTSNLN